MQKLIGIVFFVLLLTPAVASSAAIDYALDVQVNTESKTITGSAGILADRDTSVSLTVSRLHHVTVNGKEIVGNLSGSYTLSLKKDRTVVVAFEADLSHAESIFIDAEHVYLSGNWYPVPDTLARYRFSVTLPENFTAVAEADAIRSENKNGSIVHYFHFSHPLDRVNLAASKRYVVSRDRVDDIAVEAYFFNEDAGLAATYLSYAKRYLQMYTDMLSPYPYRRFAIVEHVLPAGSSLPTLTMLGREVVRLPFIVETSLAHEILHQWFGNSVYIDLSQGNWSEGLTAYLSDHELAVRDNRGVEYRKQIMLDYAAYVSPDQALALRNFYFRGSKAQSAVGYGKCAMLFHDLRKRFGSHYFFEALQHFIRENSFKKAAWSDIQAAFEQLTGRNLGPYFARWLNETDIPRLEVESAGLAAKNGELGIQLHLRQQSDPYPLLIPVSIYFEKGARVHFIDMDTVEKTVRLPVHDLPTRVVVDESYDVMRRPTPAETPPILVNLLGSDALTVVVRPAEKEVYQPLVSGLGSAQVKFLTPRQTDLTTLKNGTFMIAGFDNDLLGQITPGPSPAGSVHLRVIRNPYNDANNILLAHADNRDEALAVQKKLKHYGKYSELVFNNGAIVDKKVAPSQMGLAAWEHAAPRAAAPALVPTLHQIIPELSRYRIIYIGENHDQFAHHVNQLLIIKKLHELGIELAVGMEMFKTPFQGVIEAYLADQIDERQFLRTSSYFSEWGYNYHLYQPIIDYLKNNNIPLVALNLKSDLTGRVARGGISALSEAERRQLPASLDFADPQYREDLRRVYGFHGEQDALDEFDHFLQAQVLWDESMAEAAWKYLAGTPGRTLVILAGNGHLKYRYGIPERLYRRNRQPYVVVLQDEALESDIADFVLITEKLWVREAPRLGVTVQAAENGLKVTSVLKGSSAENAKIREGDVIQNFDSHAIATLADLRLALFYARHDQTYPLVVKRGADTIKLKIELLHRGASAHTS